MINQIIDHWWQILLVVFSAGGMVAKVYHLDVKNKEQELKIGNLMTRDECDHRQSSCAAKLERDIKGICKDVKEIKSLQEKIFNDFYKPRISGD